MRRSRLSAVRDLAERTPGATQWAGTGLPWRCSLVAIAQYHLKKHTTMRRSFTPLATCILALATLSATAQVPNGDFETWVDNGGGFLDPQDWLTSNADISLLCVEQYTPAWSNDFAMRVHTWDPGIGAFQGTAMTMFPYSQRPDALHAAVMANVMPGDRVLIIVSMWQGDSIIAMPLNCTFGIDTNITSYASVTFPITYSSALYPDSCSIIVMAGSDEPQLGTEVILDDLSFEFSTSLEPLPVSPIGDPLIAWPDPTADRTFFRAPAGTGDLRVVLYSGDGRLVRDRRYGPSAHERTIELDVRELPDGPYHYTVGYGDRSRSGRLIVAH